MSETRRARSLFALSVTLVAWDPNAPSDDEYVWAASGAVGTWLLNARCTAGQWPLAVIPVVGPGGQLWMFEHAGRLET